MQIECAHKFHPGYWSMAGTEVPCCTSLPTLSNSSVAVIFLRTVSLCSRPSTKNPKKSNHLAPRSVPAVHYGSFTVRLICNTCPISAIQAHLRVHLSQHFHVTKVLTVAGCCSLKTEIWMHWKCLEKQVNAPFTLRWKSTNITRNIEKQILNPCGLGRHLLNTLYSTILL